MPTHLSHSRIYYEDTDAGGVVYYANYLKFAERARTEALRAAGLEQTQLMSEAGIAFVVRHCSMECIAPARLDDLLTIETVLTDIGGASLEMRQTIRNGEEVLVELDVRLGVVGSDFKPKRVPAYVRDALSTLFR